MSEPSPGLVALMPEVSRAIARGDRAAAVRLLEQECGEEAGRIVDTLMASAPTPDPGPKLGVAEFEILLHAAAGKSAPESARARQKSVETVKSQRQSLLRKLEARNITHAVALAYERGLIVGSVQRPREPLVQLGLVCGSCGEALTTDRPSRFGRCRICGCKFWVFSRR